MAEDPGKVEIHRGLQGVHFDRSRVCFIDGRAGELLYRGYSIHDLAERLYLHDPDMLGMLIEDYENVAAGYTMETVLPAIHCPVLLVQEIRALALGHLTADPAAQDFLLVDFGEGVGGAIVLEGKLYSPSTPLSGELGHTPVPGNRRLCGCGGRSL